MAPSNLSNITLATPNLTAVLNLEANPQVREVVGLTTFGQSVSVTIGTLIVMTGRGKARLHVAIPSSKEADGQNAAPIDLGKLGEFVRNVFKAAWSAFCAFF